MADREDTRARAEPPLRTTPYGEHITYIGSRAQLLAAGIVGADSAFPGDPGQRKSYLRLTGDPRRIQSISKSSPGRFRVIVRRTDEEVAAHHQRQAEVEAQWKENRQRLDEARAAERSLERAARSFEDYRGRLKYRGSTLLEVMLELMQKPDGGYRLAPDVIDEVALHLHAIENLLATGTIKFDAATRDAERARLHAVAARGDVAFNKFMRKAKARG